MFSPPRWAALRKVLMAPCSMAFMSCVFCLTFLPLFAFARQMTQRTSHSPDFFFRQWSGESGKVPPQSVQTFSLMSAVPLFQVRNKSLGKVRPVGQIASRYVAPAAQHVPDLSGRVVVIDAGAC